LLIEAKLHQSITTPVPIEKHRNFPSLPAAGRLKRGGANNEIRETGYNSTQTRFTKEWWFYDLILHFNRFHGLM